MQSSWESLPGRVEGIGAVLSGDESPSVGFICASKSESHKMIPREELRTVPCVRNVCLFKKYMCTFRQFCIKM